MTVGFTGTRKGLSTRQKTQLHEVLWWFMMCIGSGPMVFVHGGALGADTDASHEAWKQGFVIRAIHPRQGESPLVRNREIVAACDVLIAGPETDKEVQRSGTWATVRYARAAGKPVVFLSRGEK